MILQESYQPLSQEIAPTVSCVFHVTFCIITSPETLVNTEFQPFFLLVRHSFYNEFILKKHRLFTKNSQKIAETLKNSHNGHNLFTKVSHFILKKFID